MQSKSKSGNRIETRPYNISQPVACSEPQWHGTDYNSISPAVMGVNPSDSSSQEQSLDGQSQSDGGLNEEDDGTTKESRIAVSAQSDGRYSQEHQSLQHVLTNIPAKRDEGLTHPLQLELVGHSIACASNPYSDPYFVGMMAAYGQPLVPPLYDMHHARMPLPLEMAQEPVYVNAKQYHGILRRRQSRAKAELERKLIKNRKPYLHESRHQHAMRRARGSGGRFAKKSDADTLQYTSEEKGSGSVSIVSANSASSSGSEPLPSNSAGISKPEAPDNDQAHMSGNDGCKYENQSGIQASTYTVQREGDSDQQWGSVSSSNQASRRAFAQ